MITIKKFNKKLKKQTRMVTDALSFDFFNSIILIFTFLCE